MADFAEAEGSEEEEVVVRAAVADVDVVAFVAVVIPGCLPPPFTVDCGVSRGAVFMFVLR